MIVVSNTSPLCYLAWIGQLDLLPGLFGEIHIPQRVWEELTRSETPEIVRRQFQPLPLWLKLEELSSDADETLEGLHAGEREALLLAEALAADLVLLDDRTARAVARARGLPIAGLLGIVDEAASRRWLDVAEVIEKLRSTSFRAHPSLLKALLDKYSPDTE